MLKAGGAEISIARTRSGVNPGLILFTDNQLGTSKPAPASRTIASAKSAITRARRIRRVATPPETFLPPSAPDGRRSPRNTAQAGNSPTRTPANTETARAQSRTPGARLISFRRGKLAGPKA